MKQMLTTNLTLLFHIVDGQRIMGSHAGLYDDDDAIFGDSTNIAGCCTDLRGDVSGLSGRVSGIWGDVTGLKGDVTGIFGDVTGYAGDLGLCELTSDERNQGVYICELVAK